MRAQMQERGSTERDVERVVSNPDRGRYEPRLRDRRDWYGTAADGRLITVVTNRIAVISVFEQ
jgi:hypothetical protein